jgi:hypothetical protein
VVVEMRRREISRKSFAARLRHEKRTKTRNPIVPFVVWKVGEKLADSALGKSLLADSVIDAS